MAKVSFYLDTPNKEESQVFLRITDKGKRFLVATGEKIPTKYWNKETQRAKKTTAYPNNPILNKFLNDLEAEANKILLQARSTQSIITKEYLKQKINTYLNGGGIKLLDKDKFFDIYSEFILLQQGKKNIQTIKIFKTQRNHLLDFQSKTRFKVTFDSIDLRFYDRLETYYYSERKALDSTWHKYLTAFKTFMNWATDRSYNKNLAYRKFKKPRLAETDIICLTDEELWRVYNLDLSKNKRLAKVRDVFCIGCFTGLRFSDIAQLKKEDVKDNYLTVRTYKTKDAVRVPLRKEAKEIINLYISSPHFLPTITNQKSNLYLKELGKVAGINDKISIVQYRGSERIEIKKPKYEFISNHTGRRTFVTLSLEAGARPEIVMEITGHKSYKTFKKYIKLTDKVVSNEMKRIWGEGDINPYMKVI